MVGLVSCGRSADQPADSILHPIATWSGTTDTIFSSPIDISATGCKVAVADFTSRLVALKDGQGAWRVVGRQGAGPGEYGNPGRVALAPNGDLVVSELSRGQLIRFDSAGHGFSAAVNVRLPQRDLGRGTIVAVNDSTIADNWFGPRIGGGDIQDSVLARLPLVARLGTDGQFRGGWGTPSIPAAGAPRSELWALNAGAMAVGPHSLFFFRRFSAVLEEYDLTSEQLVRTDSVTPLAARSRYNASGDGMAGSVALLGGGNLAVILRAPLVREEGIFPTEHLLILNRDRDVVARFKLTTRLTRLAWGGAGVVFAMGEADGSRADSGDQVIDLLRVPGPDSTDICRWVPGM